MQGDDLFTRMDDWIVTRWGLGVSWVVWCLCALLFAFVFVFVLRPISDDTGWIVFVVILFSIYAALSVIAALLAYFAWKFGMWDDRRSRNERIRDRH